jgi:hypothetical protein
MLASVLAAAQDSSGEFTIVALPDTQHYSELYPQIFNAQTQWIADNAQGLNIKLVLGLGDIVQGGGETYQWQNADAAMRTLDGKVPYMSVIGNHDYDRNNPIGRTDYAKNYNNYFGPARYAGQSWYKGNFPQGSNENFYGIHTINGKQYLVVALEVYPRDSALAWASSIVAAHSDKDVIVITHSYTSFDNTRVGRCDPNNAESMGIGADNDGEDMWRNFVSKHKNIVLVLSGHIKAGDGTGRRADLGVNGNLVNQILSDYQNHPLGGGGFLRIMRFKPLLNQIEVKTYSPYLNEYKTDGNNQFTIPYKYTGGPPTTSIKGSVRNASNCATISGATVSHSAASTTSDSSGLFTLPASAPNSYTLTARRTGYLEGKQTVAVHDGTSSTAELFLATAGKVSGYVRETSGAAVPGTTVTLTGGVIENTKSLTTDASGFYASSWIAVGDYKVKAAAPGFVDALSAVRIDSGITSTLNITLSPDGQTEPPPPGCEPASPAPSMTICTPANGATVASPVRVTAAAVSTAPITHFKIYVDYKAPEVFKADDVSTIDTSIPLASGSHTLIVRAWDTTGNSVDSSVVVNVGSSSPPPPSPGCAPPASGVTVCTPANGATVGTPFRVQAAAASPDAPITHMKIYVDSKSPAAFEADVSKIDTSLSLSAGTHSLLVQAWDARGTVFKSSPLTVNVTP